MSEGVLIAIIAGVPLTLTSIASLVTSIRIKKVTKDTKEAVAELHIAVNSRLTQLLELTTKASKAEGVVEEMNNSLGAKGNKV